jgi:hypothetical protein
MIYTPSLLSDEELLGEVKRLAAEERRAAAALVAHLVEVEDRRLHLAAGFSSLFTYCREVLLLPEDATCNRTTAVRMARAYPPILPMLVDGRLNLSTLRLLAPWLTAENHVELLAETAGRSKRDVEERIARRFPRAATTSIRRAPSPPGPSTSPIEEPRPADATGGGPVLRAAASAPGRMPPAPARRPVTPMAEDVFLIRLAAGRAMVERLRRAQDLLGHAVPRGDVTEVFDRALIALIAVLEKKKFGGGERPIPAGPRDGGIPRPPSSRYLAAAVRRAVWARDGGQCAYVSASGRRCDGRRRLEFHHRRPYAVGGEATVENIELRCRAHNQYEADLFFAPFHADMSARDSIRPGADAPAPG